MKVSMHLDTFTPKHGAADLVQLAVAAEESGLHGVWVSEHAVLFEHYDSHYPFAPDGKWQVAPPAGLLGPFTALAFLAGVTKRLMLGTGILILPEHNPVEMAKAASDLDYLSGGRTRLGVGLGWTKEEYGALQVPWEQRGKRADEYLEIMRRLWEQPVASFKGEFYDLPECFLYPKSVQKPHVPVYHASGAGRMSANALARTADYAAGWIGFEVPADQLAGQLEDLRNALTERERDPASFEVIVAPPAADLALSQKFDPAVIQPYVDAGITELVLVMVGTETTAAAVEQIRTFGASAVEWCAPL